MADKKSFMLYFDYREHLALLSDAERGALLMALLDYGERGEVPQLSGASKMAFSFIRAQIDRDNEKYEKTVERRSAAGKQGGRPTSEESKAKQDKAKKANAFSEKQSKAKKADTVTDTVTDTDTDIYNGGNKARVATRFTPPTIDDVKAYCQDRHNSVDPQRFVDFYASKGWMVGKSKMKDWKACVRTWEKDDAGKKQSKVYTSSDYDDDVDILGR